MSAAHSSDVPVLLVDDEKQCLQTVEFVLRSSGIKKVDTCSDSRDVLAFMEKTKYGAIVLDISMPHISGIELLENIIAEYSDIPVIMATAINEIETVIDCMKNGEVQLVINTPLGKESHFDERIIGETAYRMGLPLITTFSAAEAAVNAIAVIKVKPLQPVKLQELKSK